MKENLGRLLHICVSLYMYPCKGPSLDYVVVSVCSALTESNEDAPVPNAPKVSFCPIK